VPKEENKGFMHILIVHNDYGKFSGEEQALQTMAEVLESGGHKISWFRESSAGIGNSFAKKTHAMFSGIYSFKSRKRMDQILEHNLVDLVQVQHLYPFISPSILPACREKGVPVVMRCPNYRLFCPNGLHLSKGEICECCLGGKEWFCILKNCEQDFTKSIGYAARNAAARLSRMIRNNVDVFVVLSHFQKRRFVAGGISADRIEILPNIAPVVEGPDIAPDGAESISFVGRVSPEKGIRQFIEAARILPRRRFMVSGNMNSQPEIKRNAPQNVSFLGFLSGNELDDVFCRSRILVFPSVWFEGFPNVIAKAMAHGKAVIASRIGALPEIVDDGVTGLLFELGNASDLADKIDYLWNRRELCQEMGRAGMAKANKEYSEEKYYERLMGIYEKAYHLNARAL
jgi:glycosyltransferase involved in cell wall biosynthesis